METTTETTGTVSYRRSGDRYIVSVDGTEAGWVSKRYDGTWDFMATVRKPLTGEVLARSFPTRRDAVMEGLGSLRIWHGGGIWKLNFETITDELVVFPTATLRAAEERLMAEKYGEA